ncbi:hypothetical protein DM01DRAFT_1405120 [Hesseltinella vesiculosa]|uniref:RanBP-type and C3HC4-type zinc finger-containing protein 1 n=1 Tax=Hesseltinella vesiculosa TaxID=101127 RepID=A0A1X2GRI3_9FUNG|nr:hypothetical protein DM01DRAFT_1405120 [Hesseltinella vesiculosa]
MLASILEIESLLKCTLCGNLLRSTRTISECGHGFCDNCIHDRLGKEGRCPTCDLPAYIKNLRKDPLQDSLVECVKSLKQHLADNIPGTMESADLFDSLLSPAIHFALPRASFPSVSFSPLPHIGHTPPALSQDASFPLQTPQQLRRRSSSQPTHASSLASVKQESVSGTMVFLFDDQGNLVLDPPHTHHAQSEPVAHPPASASHPPPHASPLQTRPRPISTPPESTPLPSLQEKSHMTPVLGALQIEEPSAPPSSSSAQSTAPPASASKHLPKTLVQMKPSAAALSNMNTLDLLSAMQSEDVMMEDSDEDMDIAASRTPPQPPRPTAAASPATPTPTSAPATLSKTNTKPVEASPFARPFDPPSSVPSLRQRPESLEETPPSKQAKVAEPTLPTAWKCPTCLFHNKPPVGKCVVCKTVFTDQDLIAAGSLSLDPSMRTMVVQSLDHDQDVLVESTLTMEPSPPELAPRTRLTFVATALTPEDEDFLYFPNPDPSHDSLPFDICEPTKRDYSKQMDTVTHVVTSANEQRFCKRTEKYLAGIVHGKWIVSTDWVRDSNEAGYWLPERDYEIQGDTTSGLTHGPQLGRERIEATEGAPFIDAKVKIYFDGFERGDDDHHLKSTLMELTGPQTVLPSRRLGDYHILVIHPANKRYTLKGSKQWRQVAQVHDDQWLLDRIARCQPIS